MSQWDRTMIRFASVLAIAVATAVPAGAQQAQDEPPWIKTCAKDPASEREVCRVAKELVAPTGQFIASAALQQVVGEDRTTLTIAVPLGMQLKKGMKVLIDGANPLETFLGGGMSGFESLQSLLAEVPVLGEVLGLLLASTGGDFDFSDPAAPTALLTGLLEGNGPEGFGDLLTTLQDLGAQVQAIAPAGMLPGDANGFPTDAAALGNVLAALEGNSGADLLGELSEALGGGNAPAFSPADLEEALAALFSEIDTGTDGGLLGSIIGALSDLVNGLLAALGDNPLASLVTGVLGQFSTQTGGLEVAELDTALTDLLDGLGAFAP